MFHYMWLIIKHLTGDEIYIDILRDGEKMSVSFQLLPNDTGNYLIPPFYAEEPPKYLISGGLILQELTAGFLKRSGNDWRKTENRRFIYLYDNFEYFPKFQDDRIIILNRVIPMSMNNGYEYARNEVLYKVNEIEVQNLEHVKAIISSSENDYIVFDFIGGDRIILAKDKIEQSISELEESYKIELFDNIE